MLTIQDSILSVEFKVVQEHFYSFKQHLYRKHRDSLTMSTVESEDTSITDFEDYARGSYVFSLHHKKKHTDHEQQIALFLLKSKEIRKVSQVSLDGLIDDFTSLLSFKVHTLENNVQLCLLANGINMDNVESLRSLFCDPHIINPFEGLHSKYLQQKYFQEKLGLVVILLKLNPCMTNYIIIGCCGKKTGTENGLTHRTARPYLKLKDECVYMMYH